MLGYLDEFIMIGLIGLLGAISPGPDFVVVTQNTLFHGRRAGICTAIGITLGCMIHLTYCVIGIGVVVAESIVWFNLIKYLGCAYLLYIGWQALRAKTTTQFITNSNYPTELCDSEAIKKGFLANLLNPKATLFFVSVFSQVIDPSMPRPIQALLALEFLIIGFSWFSFLSFILSFSTLKTWLLKWQVTFERMMGGALILLGLKVASVSQR